MILDAKGRPIEAPKPERKRIRRRLSHWHNRPDDTPRRSGDDVAGMYQLPASSSSSSTEQHDFTEDSWTEVVPAKRSQISKRDEAMAGLPQIVFDGIR